MSMTYMKPADMQFVIECLEADGNQSPLNAARAIALAADFREQMRINRSHVRVPQRLTAQGENKGKAQWISLVADWDCLWTASQAEKQLPDFKFLGPGWYLTGTDAMLVIPDSSRHILQNWASKRLPGEYFKFMVWNNSNPCQTFNNLANAPVKVDTRA